MSDLAGQTGGELNAHNDSGGGDQKGDELRHDKDSGWYA